MPALNTTSRQLLKILRERLLGWPEEKPPFILLGAPPKLLGTVTVLEKPGKKLPLPHGIGRQVRVQAWPEENLNTITAPYMGCVLKGEADIITGTTAAMCRKLKIPGRRWIIQAPWKSFFLAPPGVPISRGGRPHWERPHPENAYSRILWMQFQTTGVRCHFCTTDKGKHWSHPYCFIYGTEFQPLAETLMEEMTQQSLQYAPLVYASLNILLHRMVRGIADNRSESEEEMITAAIPSGSSDALIQQATNFIEKHLHKPALTVELVATQMHYSPQHLARVFKKETGMTVMEFATRRRMELARQLLAESQLNIRRIADYSGYSSSSSFIKAFIRHFRVSPSAYRNARQKEVHSGQ